MSRKLALVVGCCLMLAGIQSVSAQAAALGKADSAIKVMGISLDLLTSGSADFLKIPGSSSAKDDKGTQVSWVNGVAHFVNNHIDSLVLGYISPDDASDFGTLPKGVNYLKANSSSTSRISFGADAAKIKSAYPAAARTWDEDDVTNTGFSWTVGDATINLIIGSRFTITSAVKTASIFTFMISRASTAAAATPAPADDSQEQMSFGYIDGFTWGGLSAAEKSKICTRIADAFAAQGINTMKGKVAEMLRVLNTAYTGGNDDFQSGPVQILAAYYKIKSQAAIDAVAGQ